MKFPTFICCSELGLVGLYLEWLTNSYFQYHLPFTTWNHYNWNIIFDILFHYHCTIFVDIIYIGRAGHACITLYYTDSVSWLWRSSFRIFFSSYILHLLIKYNAISISATVASTILLTPCSTVHPFFVFSLPVSFVVPPLFPAWAMIISSSLDAPFPMLAF